MVITIKIIYRGYTSKILQQAEFRVNMRRFKDDPDQEAARVAFEWLKQIQREMNVREIIEVVYNDKHDITKFVKALDKAPLY